MRLHLVPSSFFDQTVIRAGLFWQRSARAVDRVRPRLQVEVHVGIGPVARMRRPF